MNTHPVKLTDLRPIDLQKTWLWTVVASRADGALRLKPETLAKTDKFKGRLIASQVSLADGTKLSALIEGIDPEAPGFSRHNKELYVWVDGHGWFQLAQYFVSEELKAVRGDDVLCRILQKPIQDVFPIHFDVRHRAKTESPCLIGSFEHNPSWGLTQYQVMEILVEEISGRQQKSGRVKNGEK